jgi:hypothetical protein
MNVEIGAETALFPEKENINGIFVAVHRKLELPARNTLYKIIGSPKKFKNYLFPLLRPRTDHACPQKPTPSRETVPLKKVFSSSVDFTE